MSIMNVMIDLYENTLKEKEEVKEKEDTRIFFKRH